MWGSGTRPLNGLRPLPPRADSSPATVPHPPQDWRTGEKLCRFDLSLFDRHLQRELNPRHAVALALLGWYLMVAVQRICRDMTPTNSSEQMGHCPVRYGEWTVKTLRTLLESSREAETLGTLVLPTVITCLQHASPEIPGSGENRDGEEDYERRTVEDRRKLRALRFSNRLQHTMHQAGCPNPRRVQSSAMPPRRPSSV